MDNKTDQILLIYNLLNDVSESLLIIFYINLIIVEYINMMLVSQMANIVIYICAKNMQVLYKRQTAGSFATDAPLDQQESMVIWY